MQNRGNGVQVEVTICSIMEGSEMDGAVLGFIIWCLCGGFFIVLGIYALFSKKAMGFWTGEEVTGVSDIKKYNRAMAKLFCIYGIVLVLLGIPLLGGQNSAGLVIPILGTMFISIIMMAVYLVVIERRYKKK